MSLNRLSLVILLLVIHSSITRGQNWSSATDENCPTGRDGRQARLNTGSETRRGNIILDGDILYAKHYISALNDQSNTPSDITTNGQVVFAIDSPNKVAPYGWRAIVDGVKFQNNGDLGGWISDTADVDLRATGKIVFSSGPSSSVKVLQGSYLRAYIAPTYSDLVFEDNFVDDSNDSHYFNDSSKSQWTRYTTFYDTSYHFDTLGRLDGYGDVGEINLPEQASEVNGNLVITTEASSTGWSGTWDDPDWGVPSTQTRYIKSGRIWTKDYVSTTQGALGRYEFSAKIPTKKYMFPALWLTGGHEIDIMERWDGGCTGRWFLHQTDQANDPGQDFFSDPSIDFSTEFHLFALEWEPNAMRFFLDDSVIYRLPENNRTDQKDFVNTISTLNTNREKININTAVQPYVRKWHDNDHPLNNKNIFDELVLNPQSMSVDWVRVWDHPQPNNQASKLSDNTHVHKTYGHNVDFALEVIPNPTSKGLLKLKFLSIPSAYSQGDLKVSLYDVLGKRVKSVLEGLPPKSGSVKEININELPAGAYYITSVLSGSGQPLVVTKRIQFTR